MANFFNNLFTKPRRDADQKLPDQQISDARQREKKMLAKLDSIRNETLNDPQSRLCAEKMQELNIDGVIRYAQSQLKYPPVIDQSINNLDGNLFYIACALEDAIRQGHELTAEWACTALIFGIKNLRAEAPGMDQELAAALMEHRVQYSDNLRLLVELCREHDYTARNLEEQNLRRQHKHDQLAALKAQYQTRYDRGELDNPFAELQIYFREPGKLSDAALQLRDELMNLHLLKACILEIDAAIQADQARLSKRKAQIDSRRNALANPPQVCDTKLDDRVREADLRYMTQLESAAKSDDRSALLAENIRLKEQLAALQTQLCNGADSAAEQQDAIRKAMDFHAHPERMTFEELMNTDDL